MTDMTAASAMTALEDRAEPIDAIADFMAGFSLEATRPSAEEVAALAAIAPSGTRVYVSAVPTRPAQEVIEAAAQLRKAGFEPVPHLAVRSFASARALDDFLARISGEAGVVRLLIIAGDHDEPAGDFRSALEVIDGGALQRHGISEIGIAGYPDGHPRICSRISIVRWQTRSARPRPPGWRSISSASSVSMPRQSCLDRASARFRPRTSGADRLCRADQSRDPVALRQALRRAGLGPEPRAAGRPAAAAVRHVGAGRVGARARASARPAASRR